MFLSIDVENASRVLNNSFQVLLEMSFLKTFELLCGLMVREGNFPGLNLPVCVTHQSRPVVGPDMPVTFPGVGFLRFFWETHGTLGSASIFGEETSDPWFFSQLNPGYQ